MHGGSDLGNMRASVSPFLLFPFAFLLCFDARDAAVVSHSVPFVTELPKTATVKIQKYILRAQRPAIVPQ